MSMEEKTKRNARWKYHPVEYTWKRSSKVFTYRGRLCSRLKNDVYLVDWDDGSTSEVKGPAVCISPPKNGLAFGAAATVLQPFHSPETTAGSSSASQTLLQTSGHAKLRSRSAMDSKEMPFSIRLQLNAFRKFEGSKHWYDECDKSHHQVREFVAIQVFHLLLEYKIATQLGEKVGDTPKILTRTLKANNGKPPSAKESALKWAAANFLQKSRDAANSSLTPAAHTAVWCEQMLLKDSTDFKSYMDAKSLLNRIRALGINMARANEGPAAIDAENPMVIALRKFVASLSGKLENSVFEEIHEDYGFPVQWRVVAVGVDEETKQRVAYYLRDCDGDRTFDRSVSLGDCEWSSLKEVWAWVIRTTARRMTDSLPGPITIPLSKKSSVKRQKTTSKSCDESVELFALADAVEHTDIGDAWLAGDGRVPDLPPNFLQDYWTQMDLTEAQIGTSKSKKAMKSTRNIFPVTHEVVLAALEAVEVPENKSRGNVRQDPEQILEAMCLGAVSCRGAGIQASISSRDRPRLTRLLVRFAKERIVTSVASNPPISNNTANRDGRYGIEDTLYFSSIQVNKNYASAIHVDRNNYGPSLITGLGSFEGGELWTYDQGPLDIKNKWVGFDGNLPHGTLCFSGIRYSLIYFTISKHDNILPFHRNRLIDFGFPLPPISNKRIAPESDHTAGDLSSGHCAFQCWLKQRCKGFKKQQVLLCGPNCAAQYERQRFDSTRYSNAIDPNESQEAWVESISVGSRVEARYLGGESYYTGTVVDICKGGKGVLASPAQSACPPKNSSWSVDILFDDGDRDCIRDPSFLRPLVPKSPSPLSPVSNSEQAEAIKEAIASAVAASPASKIEFNSGKTDAGTGGSGSLCCPLMKPIQFTDAALESDIKCHLSNVDSELRRIVSRFPLKTRLFDVSLSPSTIGQIRTVIGYSLVASCWVVRTRALDSKLPTVNSEGSASSKSSTVDYPSQTFAQRTALDALVTAYSTWNTERQLKAKEEAAKATYLRRFDAHRGELLARFPVGTLLFDFDANVRELRYVADAVWTEGSLKEAFVGGGAEQKEAQDADIKTKRPSRGWWSLSTKPAWDIHALPWNIEKHKNKEDSTSVDEEEMEADEDEELYLAETEEQLKDLDTMVFAATDIPWQRALIPSDKESSKLVIHGKSRKLKRKSKPNLNDSHDWNHCMDQACFRGKERLKELLVERFPLRDAPSSSARKKAKRSNNVPAGSIEVCTGTILLDAVRQEERQLVECKWAEPTSTNLVWGFNRGAGGCLSDGGWALCGDLVASFVAPAKKLSSRSRSGRNLQGPLASGVTQAPPQRIMYPGHTIDDRMELDSMVAAAQARAALLNAETIATDRDNANLSTTKTSSVDKGPRNRPLGPLIPSRWARLTARELLDLIPMQSLALIAADSTTYGPFLEYVQTKDTSQASSSSSSSGSSSSIERAAFDVGHDEDRKLLSDALTVASASAKWLEERDADFEALVLGGGCAITGQPCLTQLLHLADDTPSRTVLSESISDVLKHSKMCGTQPKHLSRIKSASAAPVLTCLDLTRILSSLSYSSGASAAVVSAISTCKGAQKRTVVLGSVTTGRGDDAWKHHTACYSRTNSAALRSRSSAKVGNTLKCRNDLERSLRLLQAAAAAQVLSADEYWKLAALLF